MAGDARDHVLTSLRRHGFPLELRVGRALRQAGWRARHAYWYADPETGKPREVDLIATATGLADHGDSVTVHLVVECKQSTAVSWVAFSEQQRVASFPWNDIIVANEVGDRILSAALGAHLVLPPEFLPGVRIAHGLTVAEEKERKSGDPTAPFAAIQGALSAAQAFSRTVDEVSRARAGGRMQTVGLVLPIIVLGGDLFEYFLDAEGTEQLDRVESIAVVSSAPGTVELRQVLVVTEAALAAWARSAFEHVHEFCVAMLPHVERVIELDRRILQDSTA